MLQTKLITGVEPLPTQYDVNEFLATIPEEDVISIEHACAAVGYNGYNRTYTVLITYRVNKK